MNESNLATQNITKLLLSYATPSIISMLVVSLCNIIDRIFIGHGVGALAISGLILTLPLMTIISAIGILVGVGSSVRMSIALGAKDMTLARQILGNVLLLTFIFSAIFAIPAYIFLDELVVLFGCSESTTPYALEYLRVLIPGSIFTNICFTFCGLMRVSGYPMKSMFVILIGVSLNVILDLIFIFYFDMGVRGAAIATVISMFVSSGFAIAHFLDSNNNVYFRLDLIKLRRSVIITILPIGFAPFILNSTISLVNVILNNQLFKYGGDLAIAAWGVINSYAMVLLTVTLGLCLGMQPIVGYNFGANKLKRIKDTLKITISIAIVILSCGYAILHLFPETSVSIFTDDPQLIALSVQGLHIVFAVFPIMGFHVAVSIFFQSIGKAKESIFMNLSRQILFLIPLIYLFSYIWGLNGLWLAIPISDLAATFVAGYLLNREKLRLYNRNYYKARI